jgi:hypothetical protein
MAWGRPADAGLQVGPGRWHESPSPVWEHQDEPECAVAAHLAQNGEALALKWMLTPNNRNFRWKALEVGSVLPFRSGRSTRNGWCDSWSIGSGTSVCCG